MDNVILITIDALRADHLGFMGYDKDTSPFLDKLAREGEYHDKFFATAPYTTASITSMLTSTLPLVPDDYVPFGRSRTSIASILKNKGLRTIGVHSNPWFSKYGYGKDFDVFVDPLEEKNKLEKNNKTDLIDKLKKSVKKNLKNKLLKSDSRILGGKIRRIGRILKMMKEAGRDNPNVIYADGKKINDSAIKKIKDQEEDFFLWAHYMDVHSPHFPRSNDDEELRKKCKSAIGEIMRTEEKLTSTEKDVVKNIYDEEINYMDKMLKDLFNRLSDVCDLDKTTIIITADHGEELGEHGNFGHGTKTRPVKLYDEMIKIPLIIWNSKKEIKNKKELNSLIDIAPTILDILGIENCPYYIGESLFKERDNKEVISQGIQSERYGPNKVEGIKDGIKTSSIRTKDKKLIYSSEDKLELYDLEKYPEETTNIARSEKDTAEWMLKDLFKRLKHYQQRSEKHRLKQKIEELEL